MKVLEQDLEKQEDMEAELEQVKQLLDKEKDLNQKLLNSAQNDDQEENDDTGDDDESDEENAAPTSSSNQPKVRSGQAEQIFRQKYEEEQENNLQLQDELREVKNKLNHAEVTIDNHIKAREKLLSQFQD